MPPPAGARWRKLLGGLYRGDYLSDESRRVLLGAMSRTVTGKRRIVAHIPAEARVSHKTGSLNNTSSDIGLIECPDGRTIAAGDLCHRSGDPAGPRTENRCHCPRAV